MASLTSNPMEDMEEEYQEESVGINRSWANPGSEQARQQPPSSLHFTSETEQKASNNWTGGAPHFQPFASPATSNISLTTPISPGEGIVKNTKLENIKKWTVCTYKCSRQSLYEKFGKTSKTVDPELEDQIETLRDTQRKYSNILRLAKALSSHFYNMVQTQNSLGECFSDLAHKSPELQNEFLYNAEAQRKLTKNGQHLLASLNFFVSSVNTIVNKTIEDSLQTVKQYETARIEYDAYRTDLEFYGAAVDTEDNHLKLAETQISFNNKKSEFEKLRSDVQIKLQFLDENRVSKTINLVKLSKLAKQLLLFHNAVSAYFSGNQADLEDSIKQFAGKMKSPDPSWIEQ